MGTEFKNIEGTLIPYDYNEVEEVMKQLLLKKGVSDVIYEGSNISMLTNVVSYVISSLNLNTAVNLQETILPLASKRQNILFGARELGYEPHQKKSFVYNLLLKPKYDDTKTIIDPTTGEEIIDTNNTEERTITIVKNTKFKSGDKTYYYIGPTLEDVVTVSNYDIQYINDPSRGKPANEIYVPLQVVEGKMTFPPNFLKPEDDLTDDMLVFKAEDYNNGDTIFTKQNYLVPYKDVENDYGLQVYLTYIDDTGQTIYREEYTKSNQLLLDENLNYNKSKFIRKEDIVLGYPVIYFEYAGMGNGIRSGSVIEVCVLQSSGIEGLATTNFTIEDTVLSDEMEVITYELVSVGQNEESDDSIKLNAITVRNTGNRAVTRNDYVSITKSHPLVKEADAWGGEDEDKKEIGNIWISCTPEHQTRPIVQYNEGYTYEVEIGTPSKTPETDSEIQLNYYNWYLSDDNYKEIFDYLDTFKVMTMQMNYRHPFYINFDFEMDIVKYDMTYPEAEINKSVFNIVNNYFLRDIEKFDVEFINLQFQRVLDISSHYTNGINYSVKLTGTLCEEMIDKFNKDTYNSNKIIVSLPMPFENVIDDSNDIITDRLPRIDGDVENNNNIIGRIEIDYDDLRDQPTTRKRTDIYFIDINDVNESKQYFGEYILDINKGSIEIIFDFDADVSIEEFFGEADENGVRNYTFIPINMYPYDSNIVNIPFSKNRIARLRKVNFSRI